MALVFRSSGSAHTASGTSVARAVTGQDGTNRLYLVSAASSSGAAAALTVTDTSGSGAVWYKVGGYAGTDPRRSVWAARVGGFSNFTITVTADTTCKLSAEFSVFSGTVPAPPYYGQSEASDSGTGTAVATSTVAFTDFFIAVVLLTSTADFAGATPDAPFHLFEAVTDPATGVPYAAFYDNAPAASEAMTATLDASAAWETLAVGVSTTSPPPPPVANVSTQPTRLAGPALPGTLQFLLSRGAVPVLPRTPTFPLHAPPAALAPNPRVPNLPPGLPGSPLFLVRRGLSGVPPMPLAVPAPPPPPAPPPGGDSGADRPFIRRVIVKNNRPLEHFTEQVSDLINSLLIQGYITLEVAPDGRQVYKLNIPPVG